MNGYDKTESDYRELVGRVVRWEQDKRGLRYVA